MWVENGPVRLSQFYDSQKFYDSQNSLCLVCFRSLQWSRPALWLARGPVNFFDVNSHLLRVIYTCLYEIRPENRTGIQNREGSVYWGVLGIGVNGKKRDFKNGPEYTGIRCIQADMNRFYSQGSTVYICITIMS